MQYLMGIDMGGTVVKAAIYDLKGNEIAVCGEKIRVLCPDHDMTERDMAEAKEKTYEAVREVIKRADVSAKEIVGIGVTGQGNGAYFFDENGNPTWNAVMSSDERAKEFIRHWYADGTFDKVFDITKQQIWSGNVSAIIAWFKKHHKDVMDKTRYIVTAKDYVRYLLTGVFAMELTEGSGISCMDLDAKEYSKEVFTLLGIEDCLEKLPKIIGSCEVGGYVTNECAQITGLQEGTPVVGGLFDVCASIVSAGIVRENQLGVVVGSWSINSVLCREAVVDKKLFIEYIYGIPEYYALLEGSATSAANQEWFIDLFMERDEEVYKKCNEMVESTSYRDSILFLPFIYGTNVNIDAKAMFVGLKGTHGKAHMLRALYEGVVFCHKMHIEGLLRHCRNPEVVRMAGGAARSKVWMQMFADVLGMKVEVSQASELGAMGAALCAGVGAGVFDNLKEAAESWVRIKSVYTPDMKKHAYYQKKYHAYRAVIDAMDSVWKEIDDLK